MAPFNEETMERAALFISALNEIEGAAKLFPKLPRSHFNECYLLDGGSTDGTIEFFQNQGVPVIHKIKKGEIFNAAARLSACENIVFYAPDGNEDTRDILPLLAKLNEGCDMAIASRFLQGARNEEDGQLFKWRKWANQIFTLLVRLIWGGNLSDTINGFRAVKRSKIIEMNLEPSGFDIEFQMSIRGLKLGHKMIEIPTIEGDRIGGKSTAFAVSTGWLVLKRLIKEMMIGKAFLRPEKIRLDSPKSERKTFNELK